MSRSVTEVFVGLLIVAIPLIGLARRWLIPYPIALVLGGLALGFVPGLPAISLDPDLVLLIFLPPLLYWQSVTAPICEMRANEKLDIGASARPGCRDDHRRCGGCARDRAANG